MEAPNIILITIDSLRYDHLGCYGYHRNTSPNIDALAARGVKFMQAISNGGNTAYAFPSILASALPPLGKSESKAAFKASATLSGVLRSNGYSTAGFHSNPLLSHFYGYGDGFDVFNDSFNRLNAKGWRLWIRTKASKHTLTSEIINRVGRMFKPVLSREPLRPIVHAEEITNKSTSWLEKRKGKFFLWLHYMDVHWPYMPSAEYLSQFCRQTVSHQRMKTLWQRMHKKPGELSQADIEMLINLYDADIKYTDEIIGRLLDKLENYLDNTFVIVTADHGEAFGEHDWFGHGTLYDEIVHVPLIISAPGIRAGTIVRQPVELMDLAPTIADFAKINSPVSFHGKNLLPIINGSDRLNTGTVSTIVNKLRQALFAYRIPAWKYIYTESLDGSSPVVEEVYDLVNDPGETNNLHGEGNEEANRFELEARKKIAEFKKRKFEESSGYEKQRIRAKLSKMKKP